MTSDTILMTVQGPRSRGLRGRLSSADLSNTAFPYLAVREIDVHYARVRALRVTHVAELGWELRVPYGAPSRTGADLQRTLLNWHPEAG